jgi:hypothetical protein
VLSCNISGAWWEVDLGADFQVAKVKIWVGDTPTRVSNSVVSIIDNQGTTKYSFRIGDATGKQVFEFSTDNLCDQLLQQFHRVDEELSIQGKWQGGSVTGVCRGWGTNKVRTFIHSLGIFGDHWMTHAHAALALCSSFYPSSPCII